MRNTRRTLDCSARVLRVGAVPAQLQGEGTSSDDTQRPTTREAPLDAPRADVVKPFPGESADDMRFLCERQAVSPGSNSSK